MKFLLRPFHTIITVSVSVKLTVDPACNRIKVIGEMKRKRRPLGRSRGELWLFIRLRFISVLRNPVCKHTLSYLPSALSSVLVKTLVQPCSRITILLSSLLKFIRFYGKKRTVIIIMQN